MIQGDFDFQIRRPDGPLGRLVSGVWYARGQTPHRRERILPSPGAVILVVLGAPLHMTEPRPGAQGRDLVGSWLTGPHERPIVNEPRGETHVVGALFEPGGIGAFRDGPVDEIANRILPLDEGASSLGPGRALQEMLGGTTDADAAIQALTRLLANAMAPAADDDRWDRVFEALTSADGGSVATVQEGLGISRRHFTSQVRRRVGLRPKALQRIARMRRFLEDLDARKPIRWAEETVGAGYFDQPHAIRDFKMFTGMTPAEYVRRRQEAWGHDVEPGEAVNFIPEIIR